MLDLFRQLKLEYNDYVILFKSGNFYISFDEDATVLNNLFNYKIVELKNNFKVGFPVSLLERNIENLIKYKINYIIIENKNIVDKKMFKTNKYNYYSNSPFEIINKYSRIKRIVDILKISDESKLKKVEEIVYG